jgi:general secretion pathway protein L
MLTLILTLPAQLSPDAEVPWALIDAGRVQQQGAAQLGSAQLRRLGALRWVGIVPPQVCSVVPCDLPLVAPARMAAALRGALEERVLGEDIDSALIAAPPVAGRITQAAIVKRAWMQALLAMKLPLLALVPGVALLPAGHARIDGDWVWLHSVQGEVALLPRAVAPLDGLTVADEGDLTWLLGASAHPFNLLSGEFLPAGGAARVGRSLKLALLAGWAEGWLKPLVWGLLACGLLSLVGLQVKAAQVRGQIAERRIMQTELVKKALPNVPVIVDAPLQLQRELRAVRSASGQPNAADAEAILAAINSALGGDAVWQSVRFANGELSLQTNQPVSSEQLAALAAQGYSNRRDGAILIIQSKGGR